VLWEKNTYLAGGWRLELKRCERKILALELEDTSRTQWY